MVILNGIEYHLARTSCSYFYERQEWVAWDDTGPVDRFDTVRFHPSQPWMAWCADTILSARKERRDALAAWMNKETA